VAIAALFGAQLAGAPYMRTGLESAKVGIAGFVLPFMIIWSPAFWGDYSDPFISIMGLVVCILVFIALQAGFVGHMLTRLHVFERIFIFCAALMLMAYINTKSTLWMAVGICMFLISFGIQIGKRHKQDN
jgi:TRAP-type uncharacterized transport system fused permease subunit